ncbi:hypothetical protein PMAYCL1PPCAC_24143 [Pristionchus mayeri]|uniref:Ion channel n=1 Tax=Pristionchus mayeri TaxID=1317129 RepID=A0AAN5CZY4_9BILA|nr:hypothetical protein PMAYCL1PPCAC_24143 [Pristionchus mayeri]
MGLGAVLRDFANWSTVGGVPHISNAKSWIVRLFWVVVVMCLGGIFLWQLYNMISQFLQFPASITTEVSIEQQTFPAVTICNLNPYKRKVPGDPTTTPFDTELDQFMDHFTKVVEGSTLTDEYGIQNQPTTWEREARARDVVNMIAAKHPSSSISASLYSFDEMIADCTFNGFSCSEADFTQYVDPVYGRCFTFNNDLKSNMTVSRAGKAFGLSLLITVHQTAINDTISLYHPLFMTAGAKVAVHAPTEYPNMEGTGLTVGVGFTTAVALTASEYQLAKKPYGECIDSDTADRNYYQTYKYTSLTCYNSCRQRDAFAKCNCHNPRYFGPTTASFCSPSAENVACLDGLRGDQYNATQKNMDPLIDCNCKPACNDMAFGMTTSLATFPTIEYTVVADAENATTNDGMGSCTADNTKFSNPEECEEWYSYNALQLQVFYETMKKETYVEASSYGLSTMINDLGGQAGLYLGLSIISLIECIGLLILLCAFCVTGGRVAIRPYDDDFERDHRIMEIEDLKKALDDHDRLDHAQKKMAESNSDSSFDDENKPTKAPDSPKKESEKEDDEEEDDKKEDPKKKETESEYSGSDISDDGSISDSEEDEKEKKK